LFYEGVFCFGKVYQNKGRERDEKKAEEDCGGLSEDGRIGEEAREMEPAGDDPQIPEH
jgi:hypothetical protein